LGTQSCHTFQYASPSLGCLVLSSRVSKEEPLAETQHSQYLSILDQFESWNQELMNLPTRSCYVKVQGKEAVKITSLKVRQPKVKQEELAAVLGEYKRRYQRSRQEAEDVLKQKEDRQAFYDKFPAHEESADAAADFSNRFQNPFARAFSRTRKSR
jgi:hypothetical protein